MTIRTADPHHVSANAIRRACHNAQMASSIFRPSSREMIEFWERAHLSSIASRSIGAGNRLREEEPDIERTAYYRDKGRIEHCESRRLLGGRTQVHAFPLFAWIHNRYSHTAEVAEVGESIGKGLRLNLDLIVGDGLGHDLGHAPYGHAGEAALDKIGKTYISPDFVFKHNRHSARVAMYLDNYFNDKDKPGMNLTIEMIDAFLHHCGELLTVELEPRKDPIYYKFLAAQKRGEIYKFSQQEMLAILNPSKDTLPALTYEGLVLALADRIAYAPHDLQDALASGSLVESKLPESERRLLIEIRKVLGNTPRVMIGTLINDTINTSRRTNKIAMSEIVGHFFQELQRFNTKYICYSPEKVAFESGIYAQFENIFLELLRVKESDPLKVIDTIARMTDAEVRDGAETIAKYHRIFLQG